MCEDEMTAQPPGNYKPQTKNRFNLFLIVFPLI
jgi:hypothetical protein